MVEGKRELKNHIPSKVYEKYEVKDGNLIRKKYCPRCGPASFLAIHKDRVFCGKCHYVEINSKPAVAPKTEEKKVDAPKVEEKKEETPKVEAPIKA